MTSMVEVLVPLSQSLLDDYPTIKDRIYGLMMPPKTDTPREFLYSVDRDQQVAVVRTMAERLPSGMRGEPSFVPNEHEECQFRLTVHLPNDGTFIRARKAEKWLTQQGLVHGFIPQTVHSYTYVTQQRKSGSQKVFPLVRTAFSGRLIVTNKSLFERALQAGIGKAKAYGNGMLEVFPLS